MKMMLGMMGMNTWSKPLRPTFLKIDGTRVSHLICIIFDMQSGYYDSPCSPDHYDVFGI